MNKIMVLGYYLHVFPDQETLSRYVVKHPGVYISLGAEGLMRSDLKFREVVNCSVGYADGVGAVLAAHFLHHTTVVKIPGCELWLSVLTAMPSARIAIWGASAEVLSKAHHKLNQEFPRHRIIYAENGYTTDPLQVMNAIVTAGPDVVILAHGQPRQELFAAQMYSDIPNARFLPIGGSLDVYVGKVSRAPTLLIRLHLEWAFRLWLQPTRIRRQLVLPYFLWRLCKEKASNRLQYIQSWRNR